MKKESLHILKYKSVILLKKFAKIKELLSTVYLTDKFNYVSQQVYIHIEKSSAIIN